MDLGGLLLGLSPSHLVNERQKATRSTGLIPHRPDMTSRSMTFRTLSKFDSGKEVWSACNAYRGVAQEQGRVGIGARLETGDLGGHLFPKHRLAMLESFCCSQRDLTRILAQQVTIVSPWITALQTAPPCWTSTTWSVSPKTQSLAISPMAEMKRCKM